MTEQEVITQEEENKEIPKKKKHLFTKKEVYHSKEFVDAMNQYYGDYRNYALVTRKLNERFNTKLTPMYLKKLYFQKIGTQITKDEQTKEFFEDSFIKMKNRWEDAWEIVGDLVEQYKKLRERIKHTENVDENIMILKMTPVIIQITTEIRKQLEFIRTQQEQIKIEQKNFIYSPIQINQYINKFLKDWIDSGYIKILKKIPGMDENIEEKEDK